MKKLIIAGAISLLASTAFALDKHLGGKSEYHGDPLLDHGPGAPAGEVGPGHDHDTDVIKNFVEHEHEGQVIDQDRRTVRSDSGIHGPGHDHDTDVIKNFVEHEHK